MTFAVGAVTGTVLPFGLGLPCHTALVTAGGSYGELWWREQGLASWAASSDTHIWNMDLAVSTAMED